MQDTANAFWDSWVWDVLNLVQLVYPDVIVCLLSFAFNLNMALLLFSVQVNTMKTYAALEALILLVINITATWYILKYLRSFYAFCPTTIFALDILLWAEPGGRRKMAFGIPLLYTFFPQDNVTWQWSKLRSGSWSGNNFSLVWERIWPR